jgi:pimeloyl-ACP methyl ester carboxylesterase
VFTGDINGGMGMTFEVDWLTLEPKDQPGLAWRPVLLVHGYTLNSAAWRRSAWASGLTARDVAWHAVDVTPKGSITNNGAEITQAVDDLKKRFGVERVHIVGHSKGGLDAREHVKDHDDVETLIMLTTPNNGSFLADIGAVSTSKLLIPQGILGYLGVLELTSSAMKIYNESYVSNDQTTYVAVSGAYDSSWAKAFATIFGENDEMVSVASVQALSYADPRPYVTSVNDAAQSQGICADFSLINHCCLRYYTQIVDDLFPVYIATLTPPLPPPRAPAFKTTLPPGVDTTPAGSRRGRAPAMAAPGFVEGSSATGVQGVMSDGGIASDGVTFSHTAFINPSDVAIFLMFGQQEALHFELVSPSGSRIDATTPLADPTVTYASFGDAGTLPYTGYSIEGPEVGGWTLEVTGTSVSPPDGSVYAVAALVPLTPGTGVIPAAGADQELYAVGGAVTITATITEDGLPVTDATVQAVVAHPEGTTTTQVALHDDGTNGDAALGDGEYTGLFTATTEAGLYAILVSAERTVPAFTREQMLLTPVAQSSTAFSGTVSDHGADTDGDGLYNQLVIDVEVAVDVAATYRVFGTLTDGAGTTISRGSSAGTPTRYASPYCPPTRSRCARSPTPAARSRTRTSPTSRCSACNWPGGRTASRGFEVPRDAVAAMDRS